MSGGRWLLGLAIVALLIFALQAISVQVGSAQSAAQCGGTTVDGIAVPSAQDSPTVAAICKSGVLRSGIAIAFPGLLQDPKTGQYFGPAAWLTDKVASMFHAKIQYVPTDWSVIVAGLQADKYDMISAPLFATPARKKVVSFVNWTVAGTCYAIPKTDAKIKSLSDLNNPSVRILTYTGTGNEEGIKKAYPKATIISIIEPPGGQIAGIQQVLAHRADVAPIDSSVAKVALKKYPQVKILPGGADNCINHPDIPFPVGAAYRKDDPKFGTMLQMIVDKYRKTIDQLNLKYSDPKYFV